VFLVWDGVASPRSDVDETTSCSLSFTSSSCPAAAGQEDDVKKKGSIMRSAFKAGAPASSKYFYRSNSSLIMICL